MMVYVMVKVAMSMRPAALFTWVVVTVPVESKSVTIRVTFAGTVLVPVAPKVMARPVDVPETVAPAGSVQLRPTPVGAVAPVV